MSDNPSKKWPNVVVTGPVEVRHCSVCDAPEDAENWGTPCKDGCGHRFPTGDAETRRIRNEDAWHLLRQVVGAKTDEIRAKRLERAREWLSRQRLFPEELLRFSPEVAADAAAPTGEGPVKACRNWWCPESQNVAAVTTYWFGEDGPYCGMCAALIAGKSGTLPLGKDEQHV